MASMRRAREKLGFEVSISLNDGLRDLVGWHNTLGKVEAGVH
jgi:hypothetical protein